ncbi:MAG: hypothetical protein A2W19_10880 [Spirochaetes bacterium RBG_16_49_21]|nr:MAG: hypothetical protein A2W19_10880 [Spirochaetes bacterium RBG_16_49_21]
MNMHHCFLGSMSSRWAELQVNISPPLGVALVPPVLRDIGTSCPAGLGGMREGDAGRSQPIGRGAGGEIRWIEGVFR